MKYLIVYMSHHGTTQKVVNELKMKLGENDTTIVNLESDAVPDLSEYETIIIGGSIHMGQIQKEIKRFCKEHQGELITHRLGLFLCFMNKEHGKEEFENAYPVELRKYSSADGLFGGELLFEKMNVVEKLVTRKASGISQSVSAIDEKAIETFVEAIQIS
jgi:menaquinone-dependent protoporphyrinogen oxidase